jgi:hypothetical protein
LVKSLAKCENSSGPGDPIRKESDQQHPPGRQHRDLAFEFDKFDAKGLEVALLSAGRQDFRDLRLEVSGYCRAARRK